MAINLLDMLKNEMSGDVISQAGKFLGESEASTKSAIGSILPSILGSVVNSGSSESGAAGIMKMINDGNHDGGVFNNLSGLLGGGEATQGLMNSGNGILSSLMGNKLSSVVDLISRVSGIGSRSSSSLMSMLSPLVMGMIGRYVKNKALDSVGLSKLLGSQKSHLAGAMPSGLSNMLGFSDFGKGEALATNVKNVASSAVDNTRTAVADTADAGGSMLGKMIPWVLILGLVSAGVYFMKGCDGPVGDIADKAINTTKDAAAATKDVAGSAAGAVKDAGNAVVDGAENVTNAAGNAAMKALESVKFAAGSLGDQMSKGLASGKAAIGQTYSFRNLTFATGRANIAPESMEHVDNVVEIMKAYPKLAIEVSGHTDNTGNAASNKTLSEARAAAVKARLVAKGIAAGRISTQGYGSEKPVASNDTAEGKKKNRRIEVKITKTSN